MRIAIVGAGAVGSLLAALLARVSGSPSAAAGGGLDKSRARGTALTNTAASGPHAEHPSVVLVARGQRLEALKESGALVVKSNYLGDFSVDITPSLASGKVTLAGSPPEAARRLGGPADAVLLCVKSYDTAAALMGLATGARGSGGREGGSQVGEVEKGVAEEGEVEEGGGQSAGEGRLVGPRTLVVSCQNGVDNEPLLAAAFGWERTVGCVVVVGAALDGQGKGRVCCDRPPRLDLGLCGPGGAPTPSLAPAWARAAVEGLAATLDAANVKTRVVENITAKLWRKLVSNAALNPLAAMTGATVAEIDRSKPLRELAAAAMMEALAVGRACGQTIPDRVVSQSLEALAGLGDFAPSMLQDLRAGKPLELEALVTAVTRRGRERGVATPVLDTFEALLAASGGHQ